MTTESITLFKAIGAKMDYLNQRQKVISQNIANSDTPNFQPMDVKEADFTAVLKNISGKSSSRVSVATTDDSHMPMAGKVDMNDPKKQRKTYEVAPAGNAVIMEEQMFKSGETMMDYNMMTNLYQKHISLIKTALGR